jgi:hypothetical protein
MSNAMDITESGIFYLRGRNMATEHSILCQKEIPNRVFIIPNLYDQELFKELTNHKNAN